MPLFATIVILTSVLATTPARAANPDLEAWTSGAMATRVDRGSSEFRFNVGGGLGFGTDYHGSDNYDIHFLPLVDIEWRGAYFLSTQRGLGLNLIRRRQTKAGPRITRAAGRKKSLNTDLPDTIDLDPSYELGLFAEHFSGAWRFDADIKYGLNSAGHHGVIASAGVALGGRLSELSSLIIGGRIHYANADYMVANYGVPSSYTPTGGLRDIAAYASLVYSVTDQIYLSIDGRGEMLMEQVTLSPIVKADAQYFVGTVLGIHF